MADKFIDKGENLAAALDDFAIDGKIEPQAIATFIKAHRASIVVDQASNSLTLNGKPLREGIAAILDKEPFWRPRGGEENHQRDVVEAEVLADQLKRKALSGNVTEHGRLVNHIGAEAYAAWCAETGAKPGVPIVASEVNGQTQHAIKKAGPNNPWSAVAWNTTEQGRLARTLGAEKAAAIAAAAGCKLGSTHPNKFYN